MARSSMSESVSDASDDESLVSLMPPDARWAARLAAMVDAMVGGSSRSSAHWYSR